MRALIVDDEPLARRALRDLIADTGWVSCVGEAVDGLQAIEMIQARAPELIFLDVSMPGLSGIDVLEQSPVNVPVIFTTAHDDYAFVAFELGAIDYLRKPFGRERFLRALDRTRPHLEALRTQPSLGEGTGLLERVAYARSASCPLDRLFVRHAGKVIPVRIDDVSRFEADGDYVALYVAGRRHLVYLTLSDLAERLDPGRFVRVHRSHLVNLDYVAMLSPQDRSRLQIRMKDGTIVAASRTGTRTLRALARHVPEGT